MDDRPDWLKVPAAAQPMTTPTWQDVENALLMNERFDHWMTKTKTEMICNLPRPDRAYDVEGCWDGAWDCSLSQLAIILAVQDLEKYEFVFGC